MTNPLSATFGAVVNLRNALYDRGLLSARKLNGPVVSVGNIRVGGTGKTPFVIMLGELLRQRGVQFDVLSRGYRRKTKGVRLVDPEGSPAEFGDEPLLIARRLRVPVVVGGSRYEAGLFAEREFGPQLHLLDDGFQHRALARDYDIVLVSSDDAHDTLLPIGRLREPVAALRRADAIVLASGGSRSGLPVEDKLVACVQRGIQVQNVPSRPIVFCAIARPEKFFGQLREAGVKAVGELRFRDHHAYEPDDIEALRQAARERGADGFVTTEKDAINLEGFAQLLQPLLVARVTMCLDRAENFVDAILKTVEQRRAARA